MKYKSTADTILGLKHADLLLRDKLLHSGKLADGYNEEMEQLHNNNAEILNKIIDSIGYPTVDKVGVEASEAAWLVIQHSIGQPPFMKKCLKLLQAAVDDSKANPKNLAYLTDRIAVFEGKAQSYGTQFDWNENGILDPSKFDDLSKVNQRRKSIGLNRLEEQTEIMRSQARMEDDMPPDDFEEKKRKFDRWRVSVGWQK